MLNSTEEVEKIYNHYKGLTITFPKKLYSKKFVLQYILANCGKKSVKEMARELDLSERRVRQLLSKKEQLAEEGGGCI